MFEAEKNSELSSAKSLVKLSKFSDMSYTYIRNKHFSYFTYQNPEKVHYIHCKVTFGLTYISDLFTAMQLYILYFC